MRTGGSRSTLQAGSRFEAVSRSLRADRRVTGVRMFDAVTLRFSGKILAMLVKGRLVVKLPQVRVEALAAGGKGQTL